MKVNLIFILLIMLFNGSTQMSTTSISDMTTPQQRVNDSNFTTKFKRAFRTLQTSSDVTKPKSVNMSSSRTTQTNVLIKGTTTVATTGTTPINMSSFITTRANVLFNGTTSAVANARRALTLPRLKGDQFFLLSDYDIRYPYWTDGDNAYYKTLKINGRPNPTIVESVSTTKTTDPDKTTANTILHAKFRDCDILCSYLYWSYGVCAMSYDRFTMVYEVKHFKSMCQMEMENCLNDSGDDSVLEDLNCRGYDDVTSNYKLSIRKFYEISDYPSMTIHPELQIMLRIQVKANFNARILLLESIYGLTKYTPIYYIDIGSSENRLVELRMDMDEYAWKVQVSYPGVLEVSEWRRFYMMVTKDGYIEFGRNYNEMIIQYQAERVLKLRYFTFSKKMYTHFKVRFDCPTVSRHSKFLPILFIPAVKLNWIPYVKSDVDICNVRKKPTLYPSEPTPNYYVQDLPYDVVNIARSLVPYKPHPFNWTTKDKKALYDE